MNLKIEDLEKEMKSKKDTPGSESLDGDLKDDLSSTIISASSSKFVH